MLKEAKRIFRETTGRDPKQFRGRVTQIKKDLLAKRFDNQDEPLSELAL
jgi:hypothetical protein